MNYRESLLMKKQELEQVIQNKQQELMIPMSEAYDELSLYDQHPADTASELYEREKNTGLLELLQIELEKTDEALAKYNQGQYGICEVCGQKIEEARLQRLVNTTLCSQCAHYSRPETVRPAEEDLISPGDMSDRGEAFQVGGYELYEE